jgi:hypothetical protein
LNRNKLMEAYPDNLLIVDKIILIGTNIINIDPDTFKDL